MAEADPKLYEAIGFFEQMVQTMPGDRMSLEFLAVAYEQTGQRDKRRDCLIRLADTLLQEKDYDNAQAVAGYLSAFMEYAPARAAVERVAEQIQGHVLEDAFRRDAQRSAGAVRPAAQALSEVPSEQSVEVQAFSRSAATAEMELVWLWKEREFLPKELCMDVLHVLTEFPVSDEPVLVSALALLDELHPEHTDRLLEALQRASELPPLPIELFDVQPAAVALLSPAFIKVKGALPFAQVGGEVLVAVLNPLNAELQREVATRCGKPCHFFLSHPKSLRAAFEKSGLVAPSEAAAQL